MFRWMFARELIYPSLLLCSAIIAHYTRIHNDKRASTGLTASEALMTPDSLFTLVIYSIMLCHILHLAAHMYMCMHGSFF